MQIHYLLFIAVLLISCSHNDKKIKVFSLKGFTLIDTSAGAERYLSQTDYYSDYPVYYKGRQTDTVRIGNPYSIYTPNLNENSLISYTRTYSDKTMLLNIDTNIKSSVITTYNYADPPTTLDKPHTYYAYILSLKNISDSSIYMGEGWSLFSIKREAKNKEGKWIIVERKHISSCGAFQPSVMLHPGEFIISKMMRYKGSFFTDFRLAFGYKDNYVYSNTFRDYIDERIFENIPEDLQRDY